MQVTQYIAVAVFLFLVIGAPFLATRLLDGRVFSYGPDDVCRAFEELGR